MVNLITNFLWVAMFEFIQNIFATTGVVNIVQEYRKKRPQFAIGFAVVSGVLSYLAIGVLENRKLSGTTLPVNTPFSEQSLITTLVGCAIFIVLILIAAKYYLWKKTSFKTDAGLGIAFALLLSASEVFMAVSIEGVGSVTFTRILSHAVAFLVAFPITIAGLRKAINQNEGKTTPFVLLATLVMTVVIVAIDYGPFLKR